MTVEPKQDLSPKDRRCRRWSRYGWVLLTNWRKLAPAVFYFVTAFAAGGFARNLAYASEAQDSELRIPIVAALISWTIVGLVRAFDGRFLTSNTDKLAKLTPGDRLVFRWLQATIVLSILLLVAKLVDKLILK